MAASVLAVPVGVLFLSLVPANAIKTMAGVLIVLVSLAMLSGRSFRVRSERLAYLPIGFLSGFLNGSISMSGPPVALFMSNQNIEKDRFRANITAYAVILNVFTLATFLVSGMLKVGLTARLGCSALAMVAGVALGIAFAARIDQALFKRLTLILILSAGIWTLVTAFEVRAPGSAIPPRPAPSARGTSGHLAGALFRVRRRDNDVIINSLVTGKALHPGAQRCAPPLPEKLSAGKPFDNGSPVLLRGRAFSLAKPCLRSTARPACRAGSDGAKSNAWRNPASVPRLGLHAEPAQAARKAMLGETPPPFHGSACMPSRLRRRGKQCLAKPRLRSTARPACRAGSGGAKQCFAKPRLRPYNSFLMPNTSPTPINAWPLHRPELKPAPFLPMSRREMDALGWDACDIVIVSGDAYIDHPSFGAALIGRELEAQGFRVGIIAQPDWRSAEAFRALGRPALFFGITAGNMDSMINRYTADRKPRSDDAYTPDAAADKRPDRALTVYAQRAREAFPDANIVLGSIEASLRRIAQYDYWSEKVRRSVLPDTKADILLFGNAERAIIELAHRLAAGEAIASIRDLRGTAFMAKRGWLPGEDWTEIASLDLDKPGHVPPHADPYADAPRPPAGEGQGERAVPVQIIPAAERIAAPPRATREDRDPPARL